MTDHPLEQTDLHIGNDNDTTSTHPVRKRDKFLKVLSFSKSKAKFETRSNSNQPLNSKLLHQAPELASAGSFVDDISLNDDRSTASSTADDDPLLPPPTKNQGVLDAFLENTTKLAFARDFPRFQERFETVDHLVYSSNLLIQDSFSLSPSEHDMRFSKAELEWLVEIKKDPVERDRLQWLATRMEEAFIQEGIKDSTEIAEVVALGPILQKEPYRKLLSSFIKEFSESHLLDVNLLQGLVQLVRSSSPGYLVSDDLIKILSILRIRLQDTHQQSSEYPYHLTLAISRVLDVMADHKVCDLNRVLEHEPLSSVLSSLKGSSDPYLMYQTCYAFQALQYIPDDETVLQAVLRHSRGVVDGVVKLTALGQLDLGSVLKGLGNLQKTLGATVGIVKTVYEGMHSVMASGQSVLGSLDQEYGCGLKEPWYAAIRAAYALAEAGRLKDLNRLISEAPCRRNPLFQWGICQLLGEIAVDPVWPVTSRQRVTELLGHLYKEDSDWVRDESVKAWVLTIIDKLGYIDDQEVAASALALKQELASGDTLATRHHYPLRSRLPTPTTSPILAKVQDIPYLEYELHKLRLQRLQDYDERAVYVLPQAKPSLLAKDDELFPLLEKVVEFLASDRQVMLILGDSGSGKSSFNRHLEHLLWKEYKGGGPIPLFINLAAIDDPQHDMVDKQLQFLNFDKDQILELKLHRRLVLICDGYDESQELVNLHRTNSLNQPGQWNTKMVISCRSQYLGPSYLDRFKPQSTDRYKPAPQGVFQEAVITPFSVEQIQDYIEQYIPLEPRTWSTQDYMDKLTTIPNLLDLVKNPFLLLLALEALPDLIKGNQDLSIIKIVRVQLYDTFVNHWLSVNKRRLQSNTLSKEDHDMFEMLEEAGFVAMGADYSMSLALSIFEKQNGKAVVQYVHLKDKTTWKAKYFGPDPEAHLLREASPLTRSGSHFQFLHRSMLEYFFSCSVIGPWRLEHDVEFTSNPKGDSSDLQGLDPDSPLFARSLLTEPAVVQFLSERVQESPSFKNQLLEVIERSQADASFATAAANAISILVRAGVTFHRHDFRGIRISGADLSGGQFDSALFQGADLRNVNLAMSWLRNADFSNAQMEGVRFGELPYLEEDDAAWSCCYSPDGRMFAVGLLGGGVSLYDTSTWKKIRSFVGHKDKIYCLEFSPDNRRLVTGSKDSAVRVWDCSNGDLLTTLDGHTSRVYSVAFSLCGRYIASGSAYLGVRLWDSMSGEPLYVLEDHPVNVNSVKWSPDGRLLAACGDDGTIRFWDAETGVPGDVWELGHGPVMCFEFSPDGQQVVTGHMDDNLRLWNTASRSPGPVLRGHTGIVTQVRFSADGQRIASACMDSTIGLWDASTCALISMYSSSNAVWDVSFSSDGRTLASTDATNRIRVWDGSSNGSNVGQPGHSLSVFSVAYLPTGESILSSGIDKTVRQWGALTGALESAHIYMKAPSEVIHLSKLSPDLQQTGNCINEVIQLRNFRTGVSDLVLEGHTKDVRTFTYSPCGRWIASAGMDRSVRLWDLHNGGECHALWVLRDGKQGYVLYEMDAKSDPLSDAEFNAVPEAESDVDPDAESDAVPDVESDAIPHDDDQYDFALTFTSTGLRLAVGINDRTVNIYDTQSKALLTTKTIEDPGVKALAYSPNNQELAISCFNGVVLFLDPEADKPGYTVTLGTAPLHRISYSPWEDWLVFGDLDHRTHLCRRRQSQLGLDDTEGSWCYVYVVDGFLSFIMDIAWNPVVRNEFVTGCMDRSVRVWRILEGDDGGNGSVSADVVWGTNIGMLVAAGMMLYSVVGLDAGNRRLLKQRGAVGDTLDFERDEADVESDGVLEVAGEVGLKE